MNKPIRLILTLAILTALVITCVAASSATRRGTAVLHYMTRSTLTATEVNSNATASLRLQFNEQGHSQLQKFDLSAGHLDARTTYLLIAVLGDDTNAVPVAEFATDAKGRARVSYMRHGNGNGHGKKAMPDALNPLTNVRAIGIANTSTQTVAYAWVDNASSFQYLVKRNLTSTDTNGTAAGSISLIGRDGQVVNFRLLADGLTPGGDYHLGLNSNVLSTATSTSNGWVRITAWPGGAPALLDLRSLSLLDVGSNTVLHTSLPR